MNYERSINFSHDIFKHSSIEQTLFSPTADDLGVIIVSSKEKNTHVLRIIQLLYSFPEQSFIPVQELVSFDFQTYEQLTDFLENLPNLSGMDMLLLLNPLTDNSDIQN